MGESRVTTTAKYHPWTFDDYCALIPEGQKADLIDGVIYVASPDNIAHHDLYLWLSFLIHDYVNGCGIGGKVYGSRIAFRLDDKNSPEPDVAYLRPEKEHLIRKSRIDGPPDLAVEIVSPESVERDYQKKRKQYERFGVPEYWIIDPLEETMSCFRLARGGTYKATRPRGGRVSSRVIPGFWVRPAWFWESPLPAKNAVLQEIFDSNQGTP